MRMSSRSHPLRVLVLIQGRLGERIVGPEIRGWEIVRAFGERHQVTAAADVQAPSVRDGVPIVPRTRSRVVAEARRHDVVVAPLLPPYLLPLLALTRCVRVADMYDPVDLEFDTLEEGWRTRRLMRQQRSLRRMQLRSADLVLSANERQAARARADLAQGVRRDGGPALLKVPMGLPDPPEPSTGHPLRDRFPEIADDDPVVLWWGSVWRWLDAGTAVLAIEKLAERRPNVRFVITAGKPAEPGVAGFNAAEEVRELARSRGLLERNVFFLDEWVPYDERDRYIADADVGLTLHAAGPEAALAARARYMDYAWASLPSVLAHGDEVADQFAAAGAARLVPPRDPEATAAALDALLSDESTLAEARAGCRAIADEFRWSSLLAPLVAQVEALAPAERSPRLGAPARGQRVWLLREPGGGRGRGSRVTQRRAVAVRSAGALLSHRRLFDALERAFPVRFIAEGAADAVVTDGTAPPAGVPALVFSPGGADSEVVTFSGDAPVDRRLRGIGLSSRGLGRPLEAGRGDIVLADGAWVRTPGPAPVDRVRVALPSLGAEEVLRDALQEHRALGAIALVDLLRRVTADVAPAPPPLRAVLLFDDPNLRWRSYGYIDYRALLRHAQEHGYHAAMAMIPLDARWPHASAVKLFRRHADRLSLVIHGNNHERLELMQPADIRDALELGAQALRRVSRFEAATGMRVGRVMVPPHGMCSHTMAQALAALPYDALCATHPFPWTEHPPASELLAGWGPATFAEGCAVIPRLPFLSGPTEVALRAYAGHPIVLYGHHDDVAGGLDVLAEAAASVNRLGAVEWTSLEEIARGNASVSREGRHATVDAHAYTVRIPADVDSVSVAAPDGGHAVRGWSFVGESRDPPVRAAGAGAGRRTVPAVAGARGARPRRGGLAAAQGVAAPAPDRDRVARPAASRAPLRLPTAARGPACFASPRIAKVPPSVAGARESPRLVVRKT